MRLGLEEGSNAKSNLKNSEETDENSTEGGVSTSNSQNEKSDPNNVETKSENNASDKKEKYDNRNIIKFEPDAGDEKKEDKKSGEDDKEILSTPGKQDDKTSEEKESFKDVRDLNELVNKNQSLIKELEKKLASISEDVEDLISLYEIVSVEMNPFVGLSKITRQRIDALENIDKEFESLKARLEELETSVAAGVMNPQNNNNEDYYSVGDIGEIIDEALEYIIEARKIEDIIDEFVDDLKSSNVAV